MSIAACLIVKNEAKHLEKCLTSLNKLADEIIVVDTGSTDKTPEIVERVGARLLYYTWNNHFAQARNFGLEHIQADWVIALDGDEVLSDSAIDRLKQYLQNLNPHEKPWVLHFSFLQGKQRLLKRSAWSGHFGLRFFGRVHETLYFPDGNETQRLDCPEVIIEHLDPGAEVQAAKIAFYANLINTELTEDQPSPRRQAELYWHLAQGWRLLKHDLERLAASTRAARSLVEAGCRPEIFDYSVLLQAATDQLIVAKNISQALIWCRQAIKLLPRQAEGWLCLALLQFYEDKLAASVSSLEQARQCFPRQKQFFLLSGQQLSFQILWLHVRLLTARSQFEDAFQHLERLILKEQSGELLAYGIYLSEIAGQPAKAIQWHELLIKKSKILDNKESNLFQNLWTPKEQVKLGKALNLLYSPET